MRSHQNEPHQSKSRSPEGSQAQSDALHLALHPARLQQPASPQAVMQMQRHYGNQYVNQVLQTKPQTTADDVEQPSTVPQLVSNTGGHPLPASAKQTFESALGKPLDDVRVHVGEAAKQLGADAYHQAGHIHISPEKYKPTTPEGMALLGHELIHKEQVDKGMVEVPQGGGLPINSNPKLEQQANELGAKAARGESVNVVGAKASTSTNKGRGARVPIQKSDDDQGTVTWPPPRNQRNPNGENDIVRSFRFAVERIELALRMRNPNQKVRDDAVETWQTYRHYVNPTNRVRMKFGWRQVGIINSLIMNNLRKRFGKAEWGMKQAGWI